MVYWRLNARSSYLLNQACAIVILWPHYQDEMPGNLRGNTAGVVSIGPIFAPLCRCTGKIFLGDWQLRFSYLAALHCLMLNLYFERVTMSKYLVSAKSILLLSMISAFMISSAYGEIIGRYGIGQTTVFDFDGDSKLLEHTDGETFAWELPSADSKIVSIAFGVLPSGKTLSEDENERMVATPFAYDSESRLYRGDTETHTWVLVGDLPERLGSARVDHLAVNPHAIGRMYWAGKNTVWNSTDGGKSWTSLTALAEPVERLVLGLDGSLYAFTRVSAIYGPLMETAEGVEWTQSETEFGSAPVTRALLIGPSEIMLVPGDDGVATVLSLEPGGKSTSRTVTVDSSRSVAVPNREYSVAFGVTKGCVFEVFRWTTVTRTVNGRAQTVYEWKNDNYWDFDYRDIRIRLDIRRKSGSTNCMWNAPFTSPYWQIEDFWGRRIKSGSPGFNAYVHVYQNPRSYPFMRAVAIHVEETAPYKSCLPKKGPFDVWAVVIQDRVNGGTACDALKDMPTQTAANAKGRAFMSIPLSPGSTNPGCPLTRAGLIPCVAEATGGDKCNATSAKISVSSGFSLAFPKASAGVGECMLPDVGN